MTANIKRSGKAKWIVAAALAAGGLWYALAAPGKDKNNAPAATLVSTAPAGLRDLPLDVREVGSIIAYETVAVRSRMDSQVMEVKFKDGDAVEKGALLFTLDDRALKAQENELTANLQRDRAQADNARLQYERAKALTDKGFVSAANLDNAKAAFRAQEAAAVATQATLDNLRVQLGYTRITAPIGGRTGTINVTTGNTVKANDAQALVTINQIKPIRAQLSLSQRYLTALRKAAQEGEVAVLAYREGAAEPSRGTLEYIDNAVDQATGTFVARAVFPNADEALWPGLFVNLTLTLGVEKDALTVPEVAIQHGQASDYAFVIENGVAHKRDVKISRMQDNFAILESGLKEGDLVATDGLMSLKDGAAVAAHAEAP